MSAAKACGRGKGVVLRNARLRDGRLADLSIQDSRIENSISEDRNEQSCD